LQVGKANLTCHNVVAYAHIPIVFQSSLDPIHQALWIYNENIAKAVRLRDAISNDALHQDSAGSFVARRTSRGVLIRVTSVPGSVLKIDRI